MKTLERYTVSFVVAVLLSSAMLLAGARLRAEPAAPAAVSPASEVGIDLEGVDRAVAPGDDFFKFANGTWFRKTEIPADRSSYGSGAIVTERTNQRNVELIQAAAASKAAAGSPERKVGDYYASFMDEAAIEKKGLAPLKPRLDAIAGIADKRALARVLGSTLRADMDALNATDLYTDAIFGLWIAQDLNAPDRYVPFLLQGGLDMPDRSYYLDAAPQMEELRTKLRAHIAKVLELGKIADAPARAAQVYELERKIALVHASREDSSNIEKSNNPWPRPAFDAKAPGLDWKEYFAAAGLGAQTEFVVWHPSAITGISKLVASESLDVWKAYLTFHALEHFADVMPAAFQAEAFVFHGTALTGTPKQRDRWKRAVDATGAALGEAVGQMYVAKYFPPADKARVEQMVANLMTAFGKRVEGLEWMTPATKARARAKLATLKVHVGYPERFRDYSALSVVAGDAFGNAERAELFELARNLAKLGKPIDRSEWVMTPQTVNAVNLPVMNAMNFPAAILQPPYFDPRRPVVMDYGAIGAIIGHEIVHSFDDVGALFDETGRLNNWWTDADLAKFREASDRLVKQYDGYEPLPGLHVNGKLTLGENVADVAGLSASYDAYRLSLGGEPAPEVGGLSGDEQFFISFAQAWRTKMREPRLRQQIVSDGHSPAEYRADTVRNLDAWYAAFDVKPGQKLFLAPNDRVRVW
jgi:putative endopeptidase